MSVAITPEALEAERRIVTTCCANPSAIERVDCDPSDFGSPMWSACMRALIELYAQDRDVDPLVLADQVVKRYSGSVGYADLANIDGLPSMVPEYSRIVRTESARRRLSLGLATVTAMVDKEPPEAILESLGAMARESWFGVTDSGSTVASLVRDRFTEYGAIADARAKGEDQDTGFPTGITKLDEVLGGLQPGIVTLLAARPSMGKSTVALNLTANISKEVGVHVFSLEEPRAAYADRVISLASGVSTEKLRNVDLNVGDMGKVRVGAEKAFRRKGWIIDDRSGVRADEIVRCARLRSHENGTRVVVIDYINILRRDTGESKRDMMDRAINVFADAAKRDGMAYLVLAQLNRGVEGRDNPEPRLSDLKECGTLEERAKAVIMLHHRSEYDDRAPRDSVRLMIRKNSQGRRGFVDVKWNPSRMYVGD